MVPVEVNIKEKGETNTDELYFFSLSVRGSKTGANFALSDNFDECSRKPNLKENKNT